MKCDKDILRPFFQDLNKSMSTLVIGNHSVSSVTVRSSSRHPVCACCQLSRSASWTSWPLKMRQMAIPKYQNYQFILHTIPEETRSQNMFNVSGFPSGESQMVKYNCVLWHVRKQCLEGYIHMTSKVKGLVLIPLFYISVQRPKVHSSIKTTIHEISSFWYHKQNPHTEINQLPVTAKILSQPSIQLWVASVAVQSWQTVMGCMRDFLGLFNIQVTSKLRLNLWPPQTQPHNV